MEDSFIEKVSFKTKREVFKVPDYYIFDYVPDYVGAILSKINKILFLVFILLI